MTAYHDQNEQQWLASGSVFDAAQATPRSEVGRRVPFKDGRVFVYARAGGTIAAGDVVVPNLNKQTLSAGDFGADGSTAPVAGEGGAVGDRLIRISKDVSGVSENEYVGGYLLITSGTGAAYVYRVRGNGASNASSGFLVEIYDGLRAALDNTSVGVLIAHPLIGVVKSDADNPGEAVGVAVVSATANQYFWVQVAGLALAKADAEVSAAGTEARVGGTTDGCLAPLGADDVVPAVGIWLDAVSANAYGPVWLNTGF